MPRIALLHGFGVGLTSPLLRPSVGPTGGFRAFGEAIASGEAALFRWGVDRRASWRQMLSPRFWWRHYREEDRLAADPATLARLDEWLRQAAPAVVVCHSLGGVLLANFLERHRLPDSVRAIVAVQSNLPRHRQLHTSVPVHNLWCPWDPHLLFAALAHLELRAGVTPQRQPGVTDVFWPLGAGPHPHVNSIRSPRLARFVRGLAN
jgi:hypothetical protein